MNDFSNTSLKLDFTAIAKSRANSTADAANVNVSGLTANNDFSSPDGIWFGRNGILWVETDDGAYTDVTNCMLLAAVPGRVGDGAPRTINNTDGTTSKAVQTFVGAPLGDEGLRRFLVGPVQCEITGVGGTARPRSATIVITRNDGGEVGGSSS